MKVSPWELLVTRVKRDRDGFVALLSRNVVHDEECVLWTGTARKGGASKEHQYPVIWVWYKGRAHSIYVHQVFWMLMNKRPTQRFMEIDHMCQRHGKNCVVHLEEVTRRENLRRMNRKRASVNA